MNIVIVPNYLRNAINKKLDIAIAKCPDAEKDRETLYNQLVCYFDNYGELPEFEIIKNRRIK